VIGGVLGILEHEPLAPNFCLELAILDWACRKGLVAGKEKQQMGQPHTKD